MFSPKIAHSPSAIVISRNTLFLGPSPLIIPNDISIDSAVFVWVPNAMLYNALSVGKKTSKITPFPWDFVTLPEEDRATATGNMQEKFGKDRSCGFGDILADTQTQTDRHARSSQYFATAPEGEVNITLAD